MRGVADWRGVALAVGLAYVSVASACASSPERSRRTVREGATSASAGRSGGASPELRRISRDSGTSDAAAMGTKETGAEIRSRDETSDEPLSRSELESRARERELAGRQYPYHERPRDVRGSVDCPDVELVEYSGQVIPYNQPIEINPRFRRRLVRFERIVRDVAVEVYGRPPDRVVQYGGHTCRTVGRRGEKLSEHAFGHAIDVAGFDFEAGTDGADRKLTTPRAAEAFEVRLEDHWNASGGFDARHRRFLHRVADELQRRGPFSTLLGPAYPNHQKLFHFDFGPEFFFRIDERP